MIKTRLWRPVLLAILALACAPVCFTWAAADPAAAAAAVAEQKRVDGLMVIVIVIGGALAVFALLLCGLWSLQRNFRNTLAETQARIMLAASDVDKSERLLDTLRLLQISPFGVPEGTVRAVIALALVAVGLLILLTHKAIGLDGVGEIAGLLGTVLGFYFGTRTGDSGAQQQAKQATDNANAANVEASQASVNAAVALEAARNATTQAQEARTAATTVAAGTTATIDPKIEDARKKLVEMRSRLEVNRQITRALQQQQSGASVAGDAQSTLSKVDALLQSVDLAIKGQVTGQELLDVVQKTEALLPQLEQVGMPGVFGDAIATLKGALSSGLQIAAVAGNPAGIVGGLVLAGLKLREQHEQFQRWREAVLLQPFDRAALPVEVTDTTAIAIVRQTELARQRLAAFPDGPGSGATVLLRAAVARDAATNMPRSAATVAAELFATDAFKKTFGSEAELLEAIEEVRQSANFKRVLEALPPVVEIPPLNGAASGVSVQLRTLLELVPLLRRDTRVAAELERIAAVVEILKNQTGFADNELLQLVQQALTSGEALAQTERQTQEPPRQE